MVWDSHSWKDLKLLASVMLSGEDRPCSHTAWEDVFRRVPSLLTPLSRVCHFSRLQMAFEK